ncbi:hypothetical protein BDF14DRAFT_507243 [Spinellus fusiger]|nr:hypothetical protein BDF14DRAFT_507243 [Spinellus fusiger]
MSTLDSSSSDLNRTVLSSVTAIDSTSIPVSKAICDTNTFCTHVPHTSKHTKNQSTYIDTSHSRDQCDTTLSGIERLSHKRTWSEDLTTNEQYHGSKTYKLTVNDDAHSFYSHDDLDPSQGKTIVITTNISLLGFILEFIMLTSIK